MYKSIIKGAAIAIIMVGCDNPDTVEQTPHISSFSPLSGYAPFTNTGFPATEVTISGSEFSSNPTGNIVKINGVDAAVVSSTTTEITITVPAGATTGKISVTVNNFTGTSADDFVVLSQNAWQPVANFGGTARYGAASFVIDNFAYVGTGTHFSTVTPTHSKDFWQYDPATDTWTQKADFGGNARTYATGFAVGSSGYIGMGSGASSSYFVDLWEYNSAANSWVQKADFPGTPRMGATGFGLNSAGYVGTGLSLTAYLNDFWQYNPSTNAWDRKKDFGGDPRVFAGSFVIAGKGYLGAGQNSNQLKPDFWEYDAVNNSWIQKASLGGNSAASHSGFFSIGTKGYAGGQQNQLWMFDPVANTWEQKANFPANMSNGVGFALGGFGYIGLGNNPSGSANQKAVYKYTPD